MKTLLQMHPPTNHGRRRERCVRAWWPRFRPGRKMTPCSLIVAGCLAAMPAPRSACDDTGSSCRQLSAHGDVSVDLVRTFKKVRGKSNLVELYGVAYWIESQNGPLTLCGRVIGSARNRPRHAIPIDFGNSVDTVDILLAPWAYRGLICIVKLKEKEIFRYECLTFPRVDDGGVRHAQVLHSEILRCKDNLRLLALNGNASGDGVIALLGEYSEDMRDDPGRRFVQSGAVFLHECPVPAEGGSITTFGKQDESHMP